MRCRSIAGLAAVGFAALPLAGCSDRSFADHAEDYLDDVEGPNGEDYSEAACEEPASTEVGQTFTCTSLDANGATISWVGEITAEDKYVLREAGSTDDPSATTVPADAATTTVAATTTTSAP